MKNKKIKNETSHKIITDILNPKAYLGSKKTAIKNAFIDFMYSNCNVEQFDKIIAILIQNESIRDIFNFYINKLDEYSSKPCFSYKNITLTHFTLLYSHLLSSKIKEIEEFEELKRKTYRLITQQNYEDAINDIHCFSQLHGDSLWASSMENFIYGYLERDSLKYESLMDKVFSLSDSVPTQYMKIADMRYTSTSMTAFIDHQIQRVNREFIHADAKHLAAIHSLLHLPYPLYDEIESSCAYYELQKFNYIDFYHLLSECIIQTEINNKIKHPLDNENPVNDAIINLKTTLEKSNLNDFKLKSGSVDHYTNNIIRIYNQGNYNHIIDQLELKISECSNIASNLCLYAKCYVYTDRTPNNKIQQVIRECISNLINIYKLQHVNTSIQNLYELSVRIHPLDLSKHIALSILKVAPYHFTSDEYHKIISMTPYLYEPATPLDSTTGRFSAPSEYSIISEIPHNQLISTKNELIQYINQGDFENAALSLEKYKQYNTIHKDYIDLKTFYYLRKNDKKQLLEFTARSLIETPQSYICFPLTEIVNYVESEGLFTVEAVIVAYIYNINNQGLNKDIFNDIFEEFILSLGIERPSELLDLNEKMSEMQVFFLNKIATIDNIDYLGCFENNIDLTLERIRIIQGLKNKKLINDVSFSNEFSELIENVIFDSGVAKLSTAKIHVDTDSILQFKQIEIEPLIEAIKDYDISTNNGPLINLVNLIRDAYINNPEFGLDINLSSEIRHGFFGNIMCSKLKEQNILCELDSDMPKLIKDNTHWINYYDIVQDYILKDINDSLKKFTAAFYELLEKAENWMKTDISPNPNRVFCFDINFIDILKIAINSFDHDAAPSWIVEILNEKLESNLIKMNHKLNAELAVDIDKIFNTLLSEIDDKKRGTSLNDLTIAVQQAQSDIKESIKTVCDWFNLRKDIEFEPCPIVDVVKLAQKCFEKISSSDIIYNIQVYGSYESEAQGKDISSLVKALINCFNNSIENGTNKKTISVIVNNNTETSFKISIYNEVSATKKIELSSGGLDEINLKLSEMRSDELLSKEGGSGLYKSKYDLIHLSKNYNLGVKLDDNLFTVEIIYDDKDTNSRG
ncbi:hypothetical protein [Aeromonas caviae]|uniref:hypothetical protein n=1 Tax=Aeromonas caviae TaxID=648 RepID=UPI002B479149|nr:hypothetical protein [Aeromonas caviae]